MRTSPVANPAFVKVPLPKVVVPVVVLLPLTVKLPVIATLWVNGLTYEAVAAVISKPNIFVTGMFV
jgi:hypothetical protein